MDNMWLGRHPTKGLFVDHGKMYTGHQAHLEELDIDIDPRVKVGTLSVSQMQMIEVPRHSPMTPRSSSWTNHLLLTEKEVKTTSSRSSTSSKEKGAASSTSPTRWKIFQLCDEITIAGWPVGGDPAPQGMTMDQIIGMMVGRETHPAFPEKNQPAQGDPRGPEHPDGQEPPSIKDVTFNLHKGRSSASPVW